MKALVVLAFVGPLCAVAFYLIRAQTRLKQIEAAPTRDLAKAIRLLDKAAACDDVMPYMSSEVREEVRQFLSHYREREINP